MFRALLKALSDKAFSIYTEAKTCNLVPDHAMKTYTASGITSPLVLNLGAKLNSVIKSRPGRFTPGKQPRYPLKRERCEHQSDSGRFEEGKVSF